MADSKKNTILSPTTLTALAAVLLLGFAGPLNLIVSELLCSVFEVNSAGQVLAGTLVQLLNATLYLIYASSGFVCARFLRSTARIIAVPQLLALTAILFAPFYKTALPHIQPFTYFALGLFGFTFGIVSLKLHESNDRCNTQQVESTLRNSELLATRLQ